MRIGIIEDDALLAGVLRGMLESLGHAVAAVAHGYEEALALVGGGTCDAAFIDIRLGGQPVGIEIARRGASNGVAVVVMTGAPLLPDDLAGAALLLKPFSVEAVRGVLHSLGAGRAARA